jgi:hypothetical protein
MNVCGIIVLECTKIMSAGLNEKVYINFEMI